MFAMETIQEGLGFVRASIVGGSIFRGDSICLEVIFHEEMKVYQVVSVEPDLALPPSTFGRAGVGGTGGGDWCGAW